MRRFAKIATIAAGTTRPRTLMPRFAQSMGRKIVHPRAPIPRFLQSMATSDVTTLTRPSSDEETGSSYRANLFRLGGTLATIGLTATAIGVAVWYDKKDAQDKKRPQDNQPQGIKSLIDKVGGKYLEIFFWIDDLKNLVSDFGQSQILPKRPTRH
jgi:hypothetical protein